MPLDPIKPMPSHTPARPPLPKGDVIAAMERLQQAGPVGTHIRATPEPTFARKALEFLTGFPADPTYVPNTEEAIPALGMAALPLIPGGAELTAALRREKLAGQLGNIGHIKQDLALDRLLHSGGDNIDRAMEQGYTTPVWHGTRANFYEFSGPQNLPGGDYGIHVAGDPETASRAIHMSPEEVKELNAFDPMNAERLHQGANVMPLLARIQKATTLPDMGMWKSPGSWISKLGSPESMSSTRVLNPRFGPSTISDKEFAQAALDLAHQHGTRMPGGQATPQDSYRADDLATYFHNFTGDLTDLMHRGGYDTIMYPNAIEGKGEPSYLLTDPRQLKSIWAKFDPSQFGKSKDILAGLAAAGVGSTLLPRNPVDNSR